MFAKTILRPLPAMLLLLAGILFLYWPGLYGELVVDDLPNLMPLGDLASGAISWQDVIFSNYSGPLGRPLSMLSFVLDLQLGDNAVFQFKRTNLFLHLLCGILIYRFSYLLFVQRGELPAEQCSWWALLVTSIWLTAPLFASTVLYVIQRMTQLATMFCLIGILAYVHGRKMLQRNFRVGLIWTLSAYLIAWPAAILSKENGVLLPLLLSTVEVFWFGCTPAGKIRNTLLTLHGFFALVPVVGGALWVVTHWESLQASYSNRSFTLSERILTESRILWDYIRQLLVPDGLRMGVIQDDYLKSTGWTTPSTTWMSIAGWLLLIAACVKWRQSKYVHGVAFGVVFYLCGHLLESTVFPLELYFEHRNYLPAIGLLMGITHSIALAVNQHFTLRRWSAALVLLPLLFCLITRQHVFTWKSAEAMTRVGEFTHAKSPRLQTALVSMYVRDKNVNLAIAHLHQLAAVDGGWSAGHSLNMIEIYCLLRATPSEEDYVQIRSATALEDFVYGGEQIRTLANTLQSGACAEFNFAPVMNWLDEISKRVEGWHNWIAQFHLARIYDMLGRPERALELLSAAEKNDSSRMEPGLVRIRILISQEKFAAAVSEVNLLRERFQRPLPYQQKLLTSYTQQLQGLSATQHHQSAAKDAR